MRDVHPSLTKEGRDGQQKYLGGRGQGQSTKIFGRKRINALINV
jgi:hypothetical protein